MCLHPFFTRCLLLTRLLVCLGLVASCEEGDLSVHELLLSPRATNVMRGAYTAGQARDTSQLRALFAGAYDPRISHDAHFLGMSVYQCRMGALRKISGSEPPKPITCRPDSAVVVLYYHWAIAHGFKVLNPAQL